MAELLASNKATELVNSLLGNGRWQYQAFGAGKLSQSFLVVAESGEQFVFRIAPLGSMLQLFYEYRMIRQEPGIHKRILAETSVSVPPIIAHDFSRRLIDRDFLIMPRLEGQPLSEKQRVRVFILHFVSGMKKRPLFFF